MYAAVFEKPSSVFSNFKRIEVAPAQQKENLQYLQ